VNTWPNLICVAFGAEANPSMADAHRRFPAAFARVTVVR
jgi:hypothetical protein